MIFKYQFGKYIDTSIYIFFMKEYKNYKLNFAKYTVLLC